MRIPRIVIGGTQSGVGKTTISTGLMAALAKREKVVQPFKVGPDYIDPSFHTRATGRKSRNLDSWFVEDDTVQELFLRGCQGADLAIVEGVMGFYDGFGALEDRGSTAHTAKVLNAPVVLIVNAQKMARSAAAIVKGYQELDKEVQIRGVILNNVSSENHLKMVKEAIEFYTGVPVLGALPKNGDFTLPERHLGLVMAGEHKELEQIFTNLVAQIEKSIDLDLLLEIAKNALPLEKPDRCIFPQDLPKKIRLGVAQDDAFNFYYQDNLDLLEAYGAEIVYFSPLKDKSLPANLDGIYIGGGYPELFASQLAENTEIRQALKKVGEDGLPIYAECGGLMYLTREIKTFSGEIFPMVGLLGARAAMQAKSEALGYVNLEVLENNFLSSRGDKLKGHEFHWSKLENTDDDLVYLYSSSKRGKSKEEGLKYKNILAAYTHIHFASQPSLVEKFINFCARRKEKCQDRV